MNLQPSQVVSVRNQGCLSQNNSESPVAVEHALIRGGLLDFCLGDWKFPHGTPEIIHFTVIGCSILKTIQLLGIPHLNWVVSICLKIQAEWGYIRDMSSQLPLMEHFNRTSTSINSQRLNWFMGESQALVASIPRLWHREVSTTCGMPWSGLFFSLSDWPCLRSETI